MTNSIATTDAYAPQQQERRSSGVGKYLIGGVGLGAVGAGLGGTVLSRREIESFKAALALDHDKFESSLKIPDNASNEVLDAKQTIIEARNYINNVQNAQDEMIEKLFKNESANEISADKAMELFSEGKYTTLEEAKNNIPKVDAEVQKQLALVDEVTKKQGQKMTRKEIVEFLEKNGLEKEQAKKQAKTLTSRFKSWKNFFALSPSTELNADETIKILSKGEHKTTELYKASIKGNSEGLKEFVTFLEDDKLVPNGKLTRDAYTNFIEAKHPAGEIDQVAEKAFNVIKKYIPKKNAGRNSLIGAAVGFVLGLPIVALLSSKRNQE